jgi:hypothetical protein
MGQASWVRMERACEKGALSTPGCNVEVVVEPLNLIQGGLVPLW